MALGKDFLRQLEQVAAGTDTDSNAGGGLEAPQTSGKTRPDDCRERSEGRAGGVPPSAESHIENVAQHRTVIAEAELLMDRAEQAAIYKEPPKPIRGKLAYALAYARRGIRVFPCHHIEADHECSCGKLKCASAGKHPRNKGWQEEATTDESVIQQWWAENPEANIGVACGSQSDLTVLDVDGDQGREALRALELEHGELPETPIVLTGSGGCHYYFAYQPEVGNAVRFATGLDVRTEGGLVVGAGSRNGKGHYRWEKMFQLGMDGLTPAGMPPWLVEQIRAASVHTNGNGFKATDEPIREGEGRNNYLYRMGRSLKAKNLPPAAIKAALEACNAEQCKPPLSAGEFYGLVNQVINQPDQNGFSQNGQGQAQLPPPQEEKIQALSLTDLYSVIDEWDRRPWVWDGILPHSSLSLIVGKSETGKSTLIYALIYSIVKGQEFLGRQCEEGRVIYLAGDPMSEIVAGKTLRELGLDDGVVVVPGALVMNPSGMKQLQTLVKNFKPSLVVGDTLAATVDIDVDKYGQSYQAQQPLTQMARDFGPNFLMSHHSQKSAIDSYGVIDAALGSVGVAAVASTRMATRIYRRGGQKFHTFEMSNLRIGRPLEGEFIVTKHASGLVDLGGLWKSRSVSLDKDNIIKVLQKFGRPMSKRTLWQETRPKPKWEPYNDALDELFVEHKIEIVEGKNKAQLYKLT